MNSSERWPALSLSEWKDTRDTVHMCAQVVGKVQLALTPLVNHWWNAALRVNARGLTTGAMPAGDRQLEIQFDFISHAIVLLLDSGEERRIALQPRPVADYYRELRANLEQLGVQIKIWPVPVELADPIPFKDDTVHAAYDPDAARRFWRILLSTQAVFERFRARFLGKCSPINFYWGSFDLAVTRFSGRRAPEREGADSITKEAYSHEVSSAGFWPGGGLVDDAAFYSYAAPEPPGYADATPGYHSGLKENILPYAEARAADSPDERILQFLQQTYEAAANLGHWDRASLERPAN